MEVPQKWRFSKNEDHSKKEDPPKNEEDLNNEKDLEQAGAELGQAQLKLRLDFN